MSRIFFAIVLSVLCWTARLGAAPWDSLPNDSCPIIPKPAFSEKHAGTFLLDNHTSLLTSDKETIGVGQYLREELLRNYNLPLPHVKTSSGPVIELVIHNGPDLEEEGYSLTIKPERIVITAPTPAGLFYGVVSLLQLAGNAQPASAGLALSCWTIRDAPRYKWRGLMLDESRHFFGKEAVKRILDWMAYYKLNHFHWHLTDSPGWRLEIERYPKLTLIGGIGNHTNRWAPAKFYTQADIREIVHYARVRNIAVIPEIDMPGHASAANRAYPEFSGGGSPSYPDFTFHPGKNSVYNYLSAILREVAVLFPAGMIHLGGDEVHFGNQQWSSDKAVHSLMAAHQLNDLKAVEEYFIRRMADSVVRLGNRVLVWDEAADNSLSPDSTIIFWWRHDRPQQLLKALEKGYKTVLCPRIPLYLDFVQDSTHISGRKWSGQFASLSKLYSFTEQSLPIPDKSVHLILGIQGNIWTETIASEKRLEFMTFPRISALSEAAWTMPDKRDFEDFSSRLEQHLKYYEKAGVYFYHPFDPIRTPEVVDVR